MVILNSWRGSLVRIHGTYMYHPGAKGLRPSTFYNGIWDFSYKLFQNGSEIAPILRPSTAKKWIKAVHFQHWTRLIPVLKQWNGTAPLQQMSSGMKSGTCFYQIYAYVVVFSFFHFPNWFKFYPGYFFSFPDLVQVLSGILFSFPDLVQISSGMFFFHFPIKFESHGGCFFFTSKTYFY